jgi:CubicO group peptidase (beta-lactamase class C family)
LKNISFLLIIIFSLIFYSCKNVQKSTYEEDIKSEIIDSVKINFQVLENDKRIKKINSFFKKKFSRNQFNGNILFAENGNIISQKSFGYSNFRKKELLTNDHSFQLASVSKPFTSIAILQLIEKKKELI